MAWPTIGGIEMRSAWGMMINRVRCISVRPTACAASYWPRGSAWSAPRMYSAM